MLGINYPVLQGALGPNGTVELAAAVSNAGGLGMISTGGTSITSNQAASQMNDHLTRICDNTENNFGVNCPVGAMDMAMGNIKVYDKYINTILRLKKNNKDVGQQLKLLVTSGGDPERLIDDIQEAKEKTDLIHFHKVGRVEHAKKAERLGVDGVIAAGFEMGAHTHHPDSAVHTFVLVPQVVKAVDIPVVAAGGMSDGRSLLAALSFGAEGISMGTRFLTTAESDFADEYKQYIADAKEGSDIVLGEGRPVRALKSPALESYGEAIQDLGMDKFTELEEDKALTAQNSGNIEDGVIWSGQIGCYIDSVLSVDEVMTNIITEAEKAYKELGENFVD